MGGKHLFAGDRVLSVADSSNNSRSGSQLLDFEEDDIWAAGITSSASAGLWSLGRRGGGWDNSSPIGGPSMGFEASEEEAAAHKRRDCRAAMKGAKSAPVSVPEWGRMRRSAEAEGEEEEELVPPHEYVARVHGRTAVATSVFEGVGRTLKGRDMSRVRDTVWSRTGFFG